MPATAYRRERYQTKPCRHCGAQFTPRSPRLYCTPGCRRQARAALARARYTTKAQRAKEAKRRLRRAAARVAAWAPPTQTLLCPPSTLAYCGRCEQGHDRPDRKYCTPTCSREAKLEQDRARSKAQHGRALWIAGCCHECGEAWVLPCVGRTDAQYCSRSCWKRNARRRDKQARDKRIKATGKRDRIGLVTIAKRDGWTCHICKRKVTRKDWSLDHLNPLAHGGTHTLDNVALAHALCNSIRGASGHAQLRLVG